MTNYRRNFVPGGSYFFTVNLASRRSRLLTDEINALRAAFRDVRAGHPFIVEAIVVLLIICMRSGRCPMTMRISPRGGG